MARLDAGGHTEPGASTGCFLVADTGRVSTAAGRRDDVRAAAERWAGGVDGCLP